MRGFALIGMLLVAAPAAAQAQDEAPDALTGRGPGGGRGDAMADLQSVMDPRTPPEIGSTSIGFYTRPYGTEYRGLCRRDRLILNYGYELGDQDPARAARPYQLRTIATFHFLRPGVQKQDLDWRVRDIGKGECPAFHDPDAHWIEAESSYDVVFGHQAMLATAARLRAGTLGALRCEDMEQWGKSCSDAIIAFADPESYDRIGPCAEVQQDRCFAVHIASITIEIAVSPPFGEVKPDDIKGVVAKDGGIVVT